MRPPINRRGRARDGMTHIPTDWSPPRRDLEAEADEAAVRHFTFAMSSKLAAKRAQGYGGWNKPDLCTVEHLARLLLTHIPKGDPVDIANFCMMLFNREGGAEAIRAATASPSGETVPGPGKPNPDGLPSLNASPAPPEGGLMLGGSSRTNSGGSPPAAAKSDSDGGH